MVVFLFLLKFISPLLTAGFLAAVSPEGIAKPVIKPSQGIKFELRFNGQIFPYEVMGAFALPGEKITLEALGGGADDAYEIESPSGQITSGEPKKWTWQAPLRPGFYPLNVKNSTQGNSVLVNLFVMVPFDRAKRGILNGYRIGNYPSSRWQDTPAYDLPRGFIEVTQENGDALLSPHFKLKQFLCKQAGGYPKYLILQPRLLLKLEAVLQELRSVGFNSETLQVMSGYRTPFYNTAIGNTTTFSRHNWGDAADVFVDDDRDGTMDDLNRDGKIDRSDAVFLQKAVERVVNRSEHRKLVGGLSSYKSTSAHGPFVHVDARGYAARW